MNLRAKFVISIGLLGLLCLVPGSLRADTIVGTHNSNNCIPFNCAAANGITTYEQVYASSAFTGVTSFNQISFPLAIAGSLDSGTYTIHFSYTSQSVDGLNPTNLSANIGTGEALFGSYALGGAAPPTFVGNTFTYDPSMGNLLMIVTVSGAIDSSNFGSEQMDATGTLTSRAYNTEPGTPADSDVGLVTNFSVATSEPSDLLLLGAGLLGLLLLAARSKRHAPPTSCIS